MSVMAVATTGLRAAQRQLDSAAANSARLQVPGAQRQRVVQAELAGGAGVSTRTLSEPAAPTLEQALPERLAATYGFQANLKMLRAQDAALGSLLDVRA